MSKEATIGDLRLVSDGQKLTITFRYQPDMTVSLDRLAIDELIDYVGGLAVDEFNRRQTFRVPVWDSCGLSAQLCLGTKLLAVRATNLSLTGIFVELPPEDWVDLKVHDRLDIALRFEGRSGTYRVEVRRREGNGYGLFFLDSMRAEQIDSLPDITHVVMELQRRWLARNKED